MTRQERHRRRVSRACVGVGLVTVAIGPVGALSDDVAAAQQSIEGVGQAVDVGVDARIELFSVLERLAGRPEYGAAATPYAQAADEWFAPYVDDPAVVEFRALVRSHGIGYDAAMTLAAQLDENLAPVGPLDPLPAGLDRRWEGVDLANLLEDVDAFARATRFDEFMASQADYVSAVEEAFRSFLASRPVLDWFDGVFGTRASAEYHVVPGLLTGLMSYGVHAGEDEIYAIMSLESPDRSGIPAIGLLTEEYLVHELAHSYVNPVVHAQVEQFDGPSPALDAAAPAMEQQAYPTREIVVQESIVRALTVLYLRDAVGDQAANSSLESQVSLEFVWTRELALALDAAIRTGDGTLSDDLMIDAAARVLMPAG
jgi:uncharacterized protein DUF4932